MSGFGFFICLDLWDLTLWFSLRTVFVGWLMVLGGVWCVYFVVLFGFTFDFALFYGIFT